MSRRVQVIRVLRIVDLASYVDISGTSDSTSEFQAAIDDAKKGGRHE